MLYLCVRRVIGIGVDAIDSMFLFHMFNNINVISVHQIEFVLHALVQIFQRFNHKLFQSSHFKAHHCFIKETVSKLVKALTDGQSVMFEVLTSTCTALELLNEFFSFSICSGVKMKIGMTTSLRKRLVRRSLFQNFQTSSG